MNSSVRQGNRTASGSVMCIRVGEQQEVGGPGIRIQAGSSGVGVEGG